MISRGKKLYVLEAVSSLILNDDFIKFIKVLADVREGLKETCIERVKDFETQRYLQGQNYVLREIIEMTIKTSEQINAIKKQAQNLQGGNV